MKTTIKDIAKMVGVSPSTVSRALQNNPRISETMRMRIQTLAKELQFTPNQIARSLVKQKSRIVGIVLPSEASLSLEHPFFPQILQGIGHVAGEMGYHILLGTGCQGDSMAQTSAKMISSGYVSGLIVLATDALPTAHLEMPVVYVGHPVGSDNACYVDTDNILAGKAATQLLIDRGHQRILFLGYDQSYTVIADRFSGYQQALMQSGLFFQKQFVVSNQFLHHQTNSQSDLAQLASLFETAHRPTAIVSVDDALSISFIGFLKERGLSCPEDVSIVSFNNTQAGQYYSPSLTSVEIHPCAIGEHAMHMMLSLIKEENHSPQEVVVPFEIIERNSVRSFG